MTVSADVGIRQRTWAGYTDPGLPVGMYRSEQVVTGDVSGGVMLVQFIFRAEANAVTGRFYNIEQLEVMRAGVAVNGNLQTFNFERVGPSGLVNMEHRLRLELDGGTFGSSLDMDASVEMPLFLGSPQALADLEAQVNIIFPNTNAVAMAAIIQGYIWEPRSILAEGGLRRPVDSLYG